MDKLTFEWDEEKNNLLQSERNISFESIVFALENDKLISIIPSPSPKHPNQKCFVVNIDEYAYIVPYVDDGEKTFLKTIYPSRKYTKMYLKG